RLELGLADDRGHLHHGMLGLWLGLAGLVIAGVEAVLADIGGPGQDLVQRTDAPAPAIAGANAALVEMSGDGFDSHRAALAIALEGQPEDQAHGVGMNRIDLQRLLDLAPALARSDDAI